VQRGGVEEGSCYGAQAGLKVMIILVMTPECWDYRPVGPHLAFFKKLISKTHLKKNWGVWNRTKQSVFFWVP
jgi:hypothetical protein